MTEFRAVKERARARLTRTAIAGLAGMLACTLFAFWDAGNGFAGGTGLRLILYGAFLLLDLATIVAGATLAAVQKSAAWAAVPAIAVADTFLMLILAFNAWETVRV